MCLGTWGVGGGGGKGGKGGSEVLIPGECLMTYGARQLTPAGRKGGRAAPSDNKHLENKLIL